MGEIAYLDYSGILTEEDESDAGAASLGASCKIMILHNHGLIVFGETIEETYYLFDSLVLMNEDAAQQAHSMVIDARYPIEGLVMEDNGERSDESTTSSK